MLEAGDPDAEVDLAWQCYHQLRSIYHATTTEDRRIAEKVISSFPSCPIPEVARLGRTLKAWRQQLLAYFNTSDISNGGTEAINLIIEKVRRLAHGFRDFTHYRLRNTPGSLRQPRLPQMIQPMLNCEDPVMGAVTYPWWAASGQYQARDSGGARHNVRISVCLCGAFIGQSFSEKWPTGLLEIKLCMQECSQCSRPRSRRR